MSRVSRAVVTILLLAFITAIRLPYIANSPYEYDSWRQSDTESIALNFIEHRMNIFFPQLNYDGPLPNYVQLEFQMTTWLIAWLYRWFGHDYALARAVPIGFFVISAYALLLIARRYVTDRTAWTAVLLYGIMPVTILYSRAIMPESAALCCMLGAYWLFVKGVEESKRGLVVLSGVFMALAIAEKIPAVFTGIPLIAVAVQAYKHRLFVRTELWIFAAIALGFPFLYFQWLSTVAEFPFVTGIATKHIWPHLLESFRSNEALQFFRTNLPSTFTWCGIGLFVIGLLCLDWRRHWSLGVWAIAMLLELAVIVATIRFDYYLILTAPVAALLGAQALARIGRWRVGKAAAAAVILAIGCQSYAIAVPLLQGQQTVLMQQAAWVQRYTPKNALVVVGTDDPSLLNASRRIGWRTGSLLPDDPVKELNAFIADGARYFIPLQGHIDGDDGRLAAYLNERFQRIEIPGGYSIYKLQ
ncbi:glycosyltransferase family 39 protein [Paenibacillus doosanensis]|nr:glycosyltransferase family 39 protein [Paenibacillus doosanensis]